jgi:tetratricopeptide (TPR) repeat protein
MAVSSQVEVRALTLDLEQAVDAFDHRRTAELCDALIAMLRSSDEPFPAAGARRVLATLRRKREFRLMARVADALVASGQDETTILRQYAQALLDQGMTAAGLAILDAALAVADDPAEGAEARGLIGRAHKDRYVATAAAAAGRRRRHLERAVHAYYDAYVEEPSRLWHGINATALLNRAARDDVALAAFPDPKAEADRLAEQVLAAIEAKGVDHASWDRPTAVEANLALGRFDDALEWLDLYLADLSSDAFEFASTLRQLTEVWQLTADTEPGSTLLPLLQAKLLAREGGEVTVGPSDLDPRTLQRIDEGTGFEKVFGRERFATVRWFRNALERCRAVARVEDVDGDGVGTGFLLDGAALHPGLPAVVLMTNAHVVPKGIQAEDAVLAFRGLDDAEGRGVRVRRVIWSSPPEVLDATIVEPERLPDGVGTCPLAPRLPSLEADPKERVYVIGHPMGRPDLQLSILDNHLLDYDDTKVHYRAPTEPGSSGSPVFDRRWAVIALHHSGAWDLPRLHGSGIYQANEGIRMDQIRAALERDLGFIS